MAFPMLSWPRIDYEPLGDPIGAAIRSTVGYNWNIETAHFSFWQTSYHLITEIHSSPEQFRMEIDNLKLMHTLIYPKETAIRGRLNKHRFNTLFKPLEQLCAGVLPSTADAEAGNPRDDAYPLDAPTAAAIRLKIYQAVHSLFGDVRNLAALFDLTIYAGDEFVQRRAVLTVILYVRFYAHRRRIGPRESRRLGLGAVRVPLYWQFMVLAFAAKGESAAAPFPETMGLVEQVCEFAARMEAHVRVVSFADMVGEGVRKEVREVGEMAIRAGVAFGLLDKEGRLVDYPEL